MKTVKRDISKLDKNMRGELSPDGKLEWHSPKNPLFQTAGLAWYGKEGIYRRLPLKTPEKVSEGVDSLANCTAGAQIRFRTDSPVLAIRVRNHGSFHMSHMAVVGQGGFDSYIGEPGRQKFCSSTVFDAGKDSYEIQLFEHNVKRRMVTINLPLYNNAMKMEIELGLKPGACIEAPPPYLRKGRIIFYGTSITQGGCASRPGMCYTNILSRRINMEFINLGFSGSGRGEPEMARLIAAIGNPALFVLDYEGNCWEPDKLSVTFPEFVRILRTAHPEIPILAVSKISFSKEIYEPHETEMCDKCRMIQKTEVARRIRAGDRNIFFADGSRFLGRDFDECTVDGVHPTDLGFLRMANSLVPHIRKILDGIR